MRDRLKTSLNNGRPIGWNDDEPAVVAAACELICRRLFQPPGHEHSLAGVVADVAGRATDPGIDERAVEAVLRAALDVPGAQPADLSPGSTCVVQGVVTAALCARLELNFSAVDELIVQSERVAVERGWHPPLAA